MAQAKKRKTKVRASAKKSRSRAVNRKTMRKPAKGSMISRVANSMTDAAIDAAIELGHAAENFRESLQHVSKARRKGGRVITPIRSASKKVVRTTKRVVARVTG